MNEDLRIIRAINDDYDSTSTSIFYRTYTAEGLPDELVTGKTYQHYGFASNPPAGTERVHIQFGSNSFSVAENGYGRFKLLPGQSILYVNEEGDEEGLSLITLVPSAVANKNSTVTMNIQSAGPMNIQASGGNPVKPKDIYVAGDVVQILGDSGILLTAGGSNNQVLVTQNPTNPRYALITEEFLSLFLNHVHTAQGPTSPTTTPITSPTSVPPITPITRLMVSNANGITKTLYSDGGGV